MSAVALEAVALGTACWLQEDRLGRALDTQRFLDGQLLRAWLVGRAGDEVAGVGMGGEEAETSGVSFWRG